MIPRLMHEEIADAIQARHIQTSLQDAFEASPADLERDLHRELSARSFNQAPVRDGEHLLGHVRIEDLDPVGKRRVEKAVVDIEPHGMVTANAPIGKVLSLLPSERMLFVIDTNELTGFIVEADLNRQPVRTYFYFLLAHLETNLSELVRLHHAECPLGVFDTLRPTRASKAHERYDRQKRNDVEVDPVGALMFADLLCVVGRTKTLRQSLGYSGKKWEDATGPLEELRNRVMHANRDLLGRNMTLSRLVDHDVTARLLIHRASELLLGAGAVPPAP